MKLTKVLRVQTCRTVATARMPSSAHQTPRGTACQGNSVTPPERYQRMSLTRNPDSTIRGPPTARKKPATWTPMCMPCQASSISERSSFFLATP